MNYNEQLKIIRQKLNLSQVEMSEKLGFTQSYYSALERGAKEITSNVIDKLIKDLAVNPNWFYNSIGTIFSTEIQKDIPKIGTLRKETFADQLSKEDQNLIIALKELPELSDMLKEFINEFSIEELENLSSIGAAWIPGVKWKNLYEIKKDLTNEAYEENMKCLLQNLADYKKSILHIKKTLIEFLKAVKPLDRNNKINLPSKYLD